MKPRIVPWYMDVAEGLIMIAEGLVLIFTIGYIKPVWHCKILRMKVKMQCKYHLGKGVKND